MANTQNEEVQTEKLIIIGVAGPVGSGCTTVSRFLADKKYEDTLAICNNTSPYGLTGAIYATDRTAIAIAEAVLRHAAGNFYINDKPTGAVVGQQPFGGARASGTNDKAGSWLNMLRWTSARTIKENFHPPQNYRYPFMEEE